MVPEDTPARSRVRAKAGVLDYSVMAGSTGSRLDENFGCAESTLGGFVRKAGQTETLILPVLILNFLAHCKFVSFLILPRQAHRRAG
jgi:hypothetical protein